MERRADGRTDGRTDGWMDGWTDGKSPHSTGLRLLLGHCPATAQLQPKNCIKRGKGTADHMMPLGNWFIAKVKVGSTGSNHIIKDRSLGFTTTTPIFANVGS